ncbi:hypothetical protein Pyn_10462 [Prunus yedoensis var. nudiflora]|uniref:Uncharacterized protein n=1 Tax=Prunus yedoensis var. nudiflora TaxID=2094558 RepID=A0A314ZUZ5_PRUYE|nr:hypothetical protein Pyn_10462 [Prunus yedoensis var. nudiflora]
MRTHPSFGCSSHPSNHQPIFLQPSSPLNWLLQATQQPSTPFFSHQALPLAVGASQQLLALAAASIPAFINPFFNHHTSFLVVASTPAITSAP